MAIPSVSAVDPHKKKPRKGARKRSAGKRRSASRSTSGIMSRINAALGRGGPIVKALKGPATIIGSGILASAVNGWQEAQGRKLKIGPVDLRLLTGIIGLGVGLYAPQKAWAPVVANIGTGALASWAFEEGYDRATAFGTPKAEATAVADAAKGITVGRIGKRIQRVEKKEGKLEAKLERLRDKARRKGKAVPESSVTRSRPGGQRQGGGRPKLIDNVPLSYILPQYRKEFANA